MSECVGSTLHKHHSVFRRSFIMEPCCPSCGTADVAGTAPVNVCTECVAVNILGMSLPVAGAIATALAVVAVVLIRRWIHRPRAARLVAALA